MSSEGVSAADGWHTWPGLFTHDRLHRVAASNAARVTLDGRPYALAECGAVCVPRAPTPALPRVPCSACSRDTG